MTFSQRLSQARKARGMNQETLAHQVGVSRQAVSKWETGDALPDLPRLLALADALELPLDDLCAGNSLVPLSTACSDQHSHAGVHFSARLLPVRTASLPGFHPHPSPAAARAPAGHCLFPGRGLDARRPVEPSSISAGPLSGGVRRGPAGGIHRLRAVFFQSGRHSFLYLYSQYGRAGNHLSNFFHRLPGRHGNL